MAESSTSTRLAHASFGLSLLAFLVPGYHTSSNPKVPASKLAPEAAALGVVVAIAALTLAATALRRLSGEGAKAGARWARAAIAVASAGLGIWVVVLVVEATR